MSLQLASWPAGLRSRLLGLLERHAGSGRYAVFDADNTLWRGDLEESLLPYLESLGVRNRNSIDAAVCPLPIESGESLYGYYWRLCQADLDAGYRWIAQAFAGLTVGELASHLDALLARVDPLPSERGPLAVPRIYPAQRELVQALRDAGIRVFVVTAAAEELTRHVMTSDRYGFGLPPENIIGLSVALRDGASGMFTTARMQAENGHLWSESFSRADHHRRVMTSHILGPATWYEGKVAAITRYIEPCEQPILVAGDSPSDFEMLFRVDVACGGVRLLNMHRSGVRTDLDDAIRHRKEKQVAAQVPVDAEDGWLLTRPTDLGVPAEA